MNYDESKVETYSLPSILTSHSGMIINNVNDWEEFRRPEILYSFTNHVYGNIPGKLDSVIVKITEHGNYLNSLAKRKQVTLTFIKNGKELSTDLLIYLPNSIKKAPVFLGYNFQEIIQLLTIRIYSLQNHGCLQMKHWVLHLIRQQKSPEEK